MKPISKKQVGHFPSHPGEGIFNDKQMPKAACATVLISRGICKAPLLAELCPGDCEGESGREPDRAVSLLFVWGVLLSSPLPLFSFWECRVQTLGPEDAATINEI